MAKAEGGVSFDLRAARPVERCLELPPATDEEGPARALLLFEEEDLIFFSILFELGGRASVRKSDTRGLRLRPALLGFFDALGRLAACSSSGALGSHSEMTTVV